MAQDRLNSLAIAVDHTDMLDVYVCVDIQAGLDLPVCLSERLAQEAIWMFFSQVGRRHDILKEELVNGYKKISKGLMNFVQNRLLLFTEFYTHHTRFLFVPVSFRP